MKFAVCILTILRGVKVTHKNLYQNLIDYLDADVFLECQKFLPDDEERLKYFDRKVKYKNLYPQRKGKDYFPKIDQLPKGQNYLYEAGLQYYHNVYRFKEILKPYLDQYDFFIFVRPDLQMLFPIQNKFKEAIYGYDGHKWNGFNNVLTIVPKKYLIEFCESFTRVLTEDQYIEWLKPVAHRFNGEKFALKVFQKFNFPVEDFPENSFITAESLKDHTSWAGIRNSGQGFLYKYKDQVKNAFNNLEKYKKGQLY